MKTYFRIMMRLTTLLLASSLWPASVFAQPTITNLGVFAGGTGSGANSISADGSTVAGSSAASGGSRAFRWTVEGGLQNLGIIGTGPYSAATAISSNGSVVVGISAGTGGNNRAFRWTAALGMQSLGVLGSGAASAANAVNADGSVVAGFSSTSGFNGGAAFRWTAATGMQDINVGEGGNAYAISADGSVVVGSRFLSGDERAYRWTAVGGAQDLGLLSGATAASAFSISADGLTVGGYTYDQLEGTNYRAFTWTASGGMQSLGVLPGGDFSVAWGINANGSVVVGQSASSMGDRAFLWTSTLGMVDLNTYLPSRGLNLNGWTLTSARGISADGSAIAGEGLFNGQPRPFLVRGLSTLVAPMLPAPLLTTFTNPAPAASDFFGTAVAPMGNDRVLIGSEGAAKAYLFNLEGTLLNTFTNPSASGPGNFGASLTAVGNDRVLVRAYRNNSGAAQNGSAYLFDTNGVLVTAFTNPVPSVDAFFGWSVAAVGNDRVLIGAFRAGTAYLFNTNGVLLTPFTNPNPAPGDYFGWSVAAMGSDRVLISARFKNAGGGAAYLFRTNGTLLTTFTNPAPALADNFGVSVAPVGNDRVLIGAIDYAAAGNGGAAYMFSTNGTLLTTFANPTPAANEYFGWSVVAVGSNRVLIGAYQDSTGALQAGSVYLFSTNGTLLTAITNPTPALADNFGVSVAAVGNDRVLVGASGKDTGATDAGSAYLFTLSYPALSIAQDVNSVSVSWVTAETGLLVQQTDSLGSSAVWSNTSDSVSVNSLTNVVQQTMVTTNRFFRLHRP